nr:retrovirus-related Pol polyprotein from transposon TNT 1-94 [Tanacetum cinerariifolium]
MTFELANRAICTPAGIARDVFIPVGKFTFSADFIIVDYESDLRVPLILGRPFLLTARALIDVHGEEMILRDGDERLTLNMKHDTSSYSNQPRRESVNLINIFNVSKGCNVLSKKLPDLNYTKDLHPPLDDNLLSGSTTYSSNSFLEEFTDELALITYPPEYDDNLQFDIESDLKEIEFLLYQDKDSSLKDSIDQKGLANLDAIFVDPIPEMFTDEHTLDYSSPPKFDVYDDDFLEVESDAENVYDDPFDSKGEKIKESKLLIDELDLPYDFLPPFEYDSFISQDFSRVDALPSTNNEDKVFNPCIIIQEKPVKIITRVVQDKKLAISNASLVLEDFDPPFYEPLFFKEVPKSKMLLPFSSENKEKNRVLVINPHNKTPYELLIGRSPNLDFMRPFGCPVTILNTLDHLGKFQRKADEGFLVGYYVNNDKDADEIPGKGDEGVSKGSRVDDQEWTDISVEADTNNFELSTVVSPIPTTRVHKDHPKEQIIGDLNLATQTRRMINFSKENDVVIRALTDPSWIEAMQEELLQFKLQKVWTPVDLPNGKRAIRTKWVFRNKKDKRGIVIRNKERLVAQGYTQKEGIDYDEVFTFVARIEAIRLFLAYASFMRFLVYQMDVKSAFMYGIIEEDVYV